MKYVIDNWNPAKSGAMGLSGDDVLADLDASSGSLKTHYVWGNEVGQLLGRYDTSLMPHSGVYFTMTDQNGSVRDVLNSSGTVVSTVDYDAYGNIINGSQTGASYLGRYTYDSYAWDDATKYYDNNARVYDPSSGRWLSQDPLGFDAGDSNLYRYVKNSPVDGSDRSGMEDLPLVPWHFPKSIADGGAYYNPKDIDAAHTLLVQDVNTEGGMQTEGDPQVYPSWKALILEHAENIRANGITAIVDLTPAPQVKQPFADLISDADILKKVQAINKNGGANWLIGNWDLLDKEGKQPHWNDGPPPIAIDLVDPKGSLADLVKSGVVWDKFSKWEGHPSNLKLNVLELNDHSDHTGLNFLPLSKPDQVKDFARYVMRHTDWNPDGFILVTGCDSGVKKEGSLCQMLADLTKRTVYGTMGIHSGSVLISGERAETTTWCWIGYNVKNSKIAGLDPDIANKLVYIYQYNIKESDYNYGSQTGWRQFKPQPDWSLCPIIKGPNTANAK